MKKAKRIISAVLVLVVIIALMPTANVQAASPKLNATKKTLISGESYVLKVKNYKKIVNWSSSNEKVATVYGGHVYAREEGTATITAKCGKKKLKCKITVKYTESQKLSSIRGFIVSNIWNEGFCDLSHYVYDKTNSVGGTLNIDYTLKKLDKAFNQLGEYNKYIQNLAGHEDLKEVWNLMVLESADLYIKIHNVDWSNFESEVEYEDRTGEYNYTKPFDVSLFDTYMNDFLKLVD